MARFPQLNKLIPIENESRRSRGYLIALEKGAEVIISIDDDNFPLQGIDFIAGHSKVGKMSRVKQVENDLGIYNLCERLNCESRRDIYRRGFPFRLRGLKTENKFDYKNVHIGINEGLWLQAPDLDATTWLNGQVVSISAET